MCGCTSVAHTEEEKYRGHPFEEESLAKSSGFQRPDGALLAREMKTFGDLREGAIPSSALCVVPGEFHGFHVTSAHCIWSDRQRPVLGYFLDFMVSVMS